MTIRPPITVKFTFILVSYGNGVVGFFCVYVCVSPYSFLLNSTCQIENKNTNKKVTNYGSND
jgi:hypothetical protein